MIEVNEKHWRIYPYNCLDDSYHYTLKLSNSCINLERTTFARSIIL